ncbi:uncharacterized protein LOC126687659 [Mercurialis annua]|uniref:uncharacterized protein LOC126687659 n=1 Tax=Mercurialis annua TaxID=3986 RepID=UPI00215E4548|nr:uncharacterized protein LOC126687659 [Mercurialis annua]
MAFSDEEPVTRPPENEKKIRWSDLEDVEINLDYLLPPRRVIGPDENGIKIVIEFKFNEKMHVVKLITTTRVRQTLLPTKVLARRSWRKFGGAAVFNGALTVVSAEEIFLQLSNSVTGYPVGKTEALSQLANKDSALMVCMTCSIKGDHWTSKCPNYNKPSSSAGGSVIDKSTTSVSDINHRYQENTVMVRSINKDTSESDLVDLFSSFGQLFDMYVATDRRTGLNRGFALVTFISKFDAQRAINRLDGYGYDHLILRADWLYHDKA